MEDKKNTNPPAPNVNINTETTRILYTDNIFMTTNQYGVVLDISQRIANTNQFQIVSRIGMSREQAKEFVKQLGNLIAMTEGQLETSGRKRN